MRQRQLPKEILAQIKEHLNLEKNKLEENLASLEAQDPFSNPDRLNDNAASDTEASEETSHDRMEALEKQLKQSLAEIAEAFLRIDNGTYGICQNCGNLIDTDRLAVKPTAVLCVTCERKREK
ncbi:TraR/DksA C4-type zinc finger protein [Candidatus Gottesmanbacteria bacterium]|nr:TraR/DksA C4-type zinc finger protein [Candidatus Gottesmanbacteria bacterium]